jgi:hypothetical protein
MTKYNIVNDIQVNAYLPAPGLFTYGVSKWDGTDKWGDTGDATTTAYNLINDVYSIETSIGYDLEAGIFARPAVGTATIQLKGSKYDPSFDNRFRPNVYVEIKARPHAYGGTTFVTVFTGYIQSITTEYTKDGLTLVTINLVDKLQKLLGGVFTSWNSGGVSATTSTNMATAIDLSGFAGDYYEFSDGQNNYMSIQNETYAQSSDVYNRIVAAEGGYLVTWSDGTIRFYKRNASPTSLVTPVIELTTLPWDGYIDGWTKTTYSDITIENNSTNLVNKVNAELYTNTAIQAISQNSDSIALYGEQSAYITPDLVDAANLQKLVNDISFVAPDLTVSSIGFSALTRSGYLHVNAVFLNPHNTVKVIFINETVNFTGTFIVNKVKHSITADNWFTTLETWKGI